MTVELIWDGKKKIICVPYIPYSELYNYHEVYLGQKYKQTTLKDVI